MVAFENPHPHPPAPRIRRSTTSGCRFSMTPTDNWPQHWPPGPPNRPWTKAMTAPPAGNGYGGSAPLAGCDTASRRLTAVPCPGWTLAPWCCFAKP